VQPLQPFLARYHARLLPVVSKALDQDHRAMHMFINDQPQTLLPPPPDWHRLRNINTSDDLHQHA
jgi:molybdopterin-guanine dinucleotide biosynthesis protein A